MRSGAAPPDRVDVLDDPLPVQYVRLLKSILNGDVEGFYNLRRHAQGHPRGAAGVALARRRLAPDLRPLTGSLAGPRHHHAGRGRYSLPSLVLAALLWAFLASRWTLFPQEGYVPLTEDPLEDWVRTARVKVYRRR